MVPLFSKVKQQNFSLPFHRLSSVGCNCLFLSFYLLRELGEVKLIIIIILLQVIENLM